MPDISMCMSQSCPLRETCYRHAASGTVPHPTWQSYAGFVWNKDAAAPACAYYWPLKVKHGQP